MRRLLTFSRAIDRLSGMIGQALSWVTLALIALGVINVVGRYVGAQLGMQLSSNALLEAQTQAFDVILLLGAAYLLKRDGHIRVDILHSRLPPRVRAWIDVIGTLLLLAPFCALVIWFSLEYVGRSWSRLEVSPNPGGLPLYPIKTLIPLAFALLVLQGVSELIKRIAILAGIPGAVEPATEGD
jgi:TRAP-type mannitol/chloroaromatic compound transport system permease small subunit